MPKLRVTKHGGFKYGVGPARKQYGKGQELLVKQKDARYLIAAQLAEEVVEDGGEEAKTKAPRAARAAAKAPARKGAAGAKTASAAGRYNRRDMKAR